MAGTLTPYAAFELVSRLKAQTNLEVQLHAHATSGLSDMTILKAVEAGINLDDPHADQIADIVLNTRDVAQIWEKLAQLVGLSSKLLPQFLKCVTKSC